MQFRFYYTAMANELKIYKELSFIETFDGEIYAIDEPLIKLKSMMNREDIKYVDVGSEMIAKSTIKRIYTKRCDDVDNAIYNIEDKNIRAKVEREVKQRRVKGMSVNIAIFQNILDRVSKE